MAAMIKPNQEKIRRIIRNWLASRNTAIRALAREAGIQPSIISRFLSGQTTLEAGAALKLYKVFHRTMPFSERQGFLDAAGLMLFPAKSAFDNEPLCIADNRILDSLSAEPYKLGIRLMDIGTELDLARRLWEEAILLFREAEKKFAVASRSMAARASCMTVKQYMHLGGYREAEEELLRIKRSYLMDIETETLWYGIKGCLSYYEGNFTQAEDCFKKCVEFAGQTGLDYTADRAQHFMGLLYRDKGTICGQGYEQNLWYHKSATRLENSFSIHKKHGSEWWMAFDLFRKAQLFQVQGKWQEAQKLRKNARALFGNKNRAVLHIDMEEARIAAEKGEIQASARKAEDVLRGWGEGKYAKGMADALRVLGETASVRLDHPKVLELYVAALCIYPFENHPGNIKLWEEIERHRNYILKEKNGPKNYARLMDRIRELIACREGYFSFLNNVSPDRSRDITAILEKLLINPSP